MRLGLIPAPGTSPDGALSRELAAYARAFGDVHWLAGRATARVLPSGQISWNGARPRPWECDVLRVLNLRGVGSALAAKLLRGTPFVLGLGFDPARLARFHGKRGRAVAWTILRRVAIAHAATVVVPSEGLARRWRLERTGAHVVVIPYGVDLTRFWPRVPQPPRPPAMVISVARLSPEKNLGALIEACRGLDVVLTLVGDGPERPALAHRAQAKPSVPVHLAGHVPWTDVPALLRGAHVFALPSWEEGAPKSLLEAMATGLPCVASDVIPLDAGTPVLRASPQSVPDLREALRVALDAAEGLRRGAAGRAWIETHHDLGRQLEAEIRVIQQAAS